MLREIPNNEPETIQTLDDSIIPEPFNFNQKLDAAHKHRRRSTNSTCNDRYLLFMFDTSGSIGETKFTRMVSNVSDLVTFFCGNTKIAAMTFSSHIYHQFCFKCNVNNQEDTGQIREAIASIPYHGGWTRTGEAVKCACNKILTIPCGLPDRESYNECPAPIDVVIITDGQSNGRLKVCDEVKCLHNHPFYGINTFSIGVGNYDIAELSCIEGPTGDDDDKHILDVEDMDELEELIDKIITYLMTPIDPNAPDNEDNYHKCYDLNKPLES